MRVIHSKLDGVPCEYQILEKLGRGAYSQVYKCERTLNGVKEIFVGSKIKWIIDRQ